MFQTDKYVSQRTMARLLDVNQTTLAGWTRQGKVPFLINQIPGRKFFAPVAVVRAVAGFSPRVINRMRDYELVALALSGSDDYAKPLVPFDAMLPDGTEPPGERMAFGDAAASPPPTSINIASPIHTQAPSQPQPAPALPGPASAPPEASAVPDDGRSPARDSVINAGDYGAARARKTIAEAKMAELKLAQASGSLVAKIDVTAVWTQHIIQVREAVLAVPSRVTAALAQELGRDQTARVRAMVEKELNDLLHRLARPSGGETGEELMEDLDETA